LLGAHARQPGALWQGNPASREVAVRRGRHHDWFPGRDRAKFTAENSDSRRPTVGL